MAQKAAVSPLMALTLAWLILGLSAIIVEAKETSCNHGASHRKTCGGKDYDICEAVCCDDQLHQGAGLLCCGKQPFNPLTASCCETGHGPNLTAVIIPGLSELVSQCCELQAYNPLNEICCNSNVIAKPAPMTKCCDKEAFDEDTQLCCGPPGNKTILTKKSSHHRCCGHDQYNITAECCCLMNKKDLEIQPLNSSCCINNSEAFDEDTQLCCGPPGNKTILTKKSSHHRCCGHDQYNITAECCCSMNEKDLEIQPLNSSCCINDSEALDESMKLFCGPTGNKTILTKKSSHHRCCGHDQYDITAECCCPVNENDLEIQPLNSCCCINDSGVKQQKPALSSMHHSSDPHTRLCRSEFHCSRRKQRKSHSVSISGRCDAVPTLYNPRTHLCCDGCVSELTTLIDKISGSRQHCCGTEVYRPHTEICCNGHRYFKEENVHCCGAKAYNIKDPHMKCCAGTLYNITSLGKNGQDSQSVCCSDEHLQLIYPAKTGMRCCGHQYYNTTLWSCCGGKLHHIHQSRWKQSETIKESRFLPISNVNENTLCKGMQIGIVESVSSLRIVFNNVLKIHGRNTTVMALPSSHILEIPDRCNSTRVIPGKTYFFDEFNVFIDFNHMSTLQSLHFILSKCYHP
ncbi:uncharacterized protein si:ch211-195m9.3 isoform X2 [Anabas testudineus]|uniref:uncharacterized protein si:ch211-195m9.3 isoform X2 n=1 Tax=Anabas testudineus TaxID=64144 RepID=UPI000E4588E3|nr:uncharacterized protein si:ch211-195m9.3 isoform X2 [Anabas testudineus]